MPSRDHVGAVALRRPAVRRFLALPIVCLAALLPGAAPALAADRAPLDAARDALELTERRLSLMDQVMVTKWLNRSPVEDRAQEQVVLDGALALTRPRGLADAGVLDFFTQQITAAKEVQSGWGDEWLLNGFPAGRTAPDLTALRAELAGLNPQLADALADLGSLRCEADARATLMGTVGELIRTRFVTAERRSQIVDALLGVRREGAADCTPRQPVGVADGVRIARRGRQYALVFTRRADRLWRQVAGREVQVRCARLGRSDGDWVMSEGMTIDELRAPRRRRPILLGSVTRDDYCEVALLPRPGETRTLVRIPLTQAGAVVVDRREKALAIELVMLIAESLARRPNAFPAPVRLTTGRAARYFRHEGLGVVALADPQDTPPTGRIGYFSDGGQHAAFVALSATGERLYIEVGPGRAVSTNFPGELFAD